MRARREVRDVKLLVNRSAGGADVCKLAWGSLPPASRTIASGRFFGIWCPLTSRTVGASTYSVLGTVLELTVWADNFNM